MDEVERCHKLAILEDGIKRADGTPEQLMNNIAAHLVEIEANELRLLKRQLIKMPEIVSVAQLGARLRVLISNTVNDPIDFLKYNTNIMPDKLSLARPSLEDVFIICTGSSRQ